MAMPKGWSAAMLTRRVGHPARQSFNVMGDAVNVSARYGVVLLQPAGSAARDFVAYLLSPAGQAVLASSLVLSLLAAALGMLLHAQQLGHWLAH